jgi:SWI/SNF related-matrix-associated actin-dependent regulator of chromatin subfamily C
VEGSGKITQGSSAQSGTNLKIVVPKSVDAAISASMATGASSYGVAAGDIKCSVCAVVCTDNYFHKSEPPKRTPSLAPPGPQNLSLSLCPLCYADGRFPSELSSVDFIHVDTQSFPSLRTISWTDKEVLCLLEAIEEQSNSGVSADKFDWDKVALTVGRSKEQCVIQFLKLPTVESLDSQVPLEKVSEKTTLNGFPFGQVENPVMSTVAFLASMVHPKVAAAAAHAAISELSKLWKAEKEASSKMDIDGETQSSADAVSKDALQQIAATAIGSTAARAHQLSGDEAERLQKLREVLVDLQMQKIKIKLALFEDLEKGLEEDKKDVEQQRLQLFIDRFNLRKMMLKSQQSGQVSPMHSKQPSSNASNPSGPSSNGTKSVMTQL